MDFIKGQALLHKVLSYSEHLKGFREAVCYVDVETFLCIQSHYLCATLKQKQHPNLSSLSDRFAYVSTGLVSQSVMILSH